MGNPVGVKETVNTLASAPRPGNGLGAGGVVDGCASRIEHLVSQAIATGPSALALASFAGALSYAELDERATILAEELRELGVGPGDLVALAVARSPAVGVGALGILRAGAAYVSLDPSYPRERLDFMLSDCGTRVVVESSSDPCVPKVIPFGDRAGAGAGQKLAESRHDPAYVIYTSGSTGLPKGVVVSHASLLNLVRWHQEAFSVSAQDRASLVASPGFDASVWELWPYLATGASVHVPPDDVRSDPVAWRDWLVKERITLAFAPTAVAERLMELHWPSDTSLRYLLTGGDALLATPPPGLGFVVVNNYGVTEATVVATSVPVRPSGAPTPAPPIGRAITGAELHVVDEALQPVAGGEAGELLIGGVCVASGYLNRPELTAERFITDHIGCEPGGRLYRTGDLVRRRRDDNLEFLGRMDDQVKIRGYRIECGEVATGLLRHPDVRSCMVVATGERSGERRLVAYLVAAGERQPDVEELRGHLGLILPAYMTPSAFVWLAELPTSPHGKIDRHALPRPEVAEPAPDADEVASDLEGVVGSIVTGLLGLASIGVNEDFFLRGGHSLFAAQLIAALSDQVGVEVPLRAVFEGPSVRELATQLEGLVLAEIEEMSEDEAERLVSRIAPQD
jgi:amino acid adenylation domain-containing protein